MKGQKNIHAHKNLNGCIAPLLRREVGVSIVLFLMLFTFCSCVSAQVVATFKSDSTKVEIGDHLGMKLVISTDPGIILDFPKFSGDTIGKIDILKKGKIDTARYTQDIVISAYEEGRYFFNPSKIYFLDKSKGSLDSTYTNDWQILVTAPAVDTTKPIKPIKAPLKVDYKLSEFTWWIAGGIILLLALIGFIIWYRWNKNKPAPTVARPRPKEPAHIWATKELQKLEQEKLWQNDEVKQYHTRLTDILRLYLEFRFNYYAMEATSEEIIEQTRGLAIEGDARDKLGSILRLADFVKFAKLNPAPDQNIKSLQDAIAFVDLTKPVEEVPNPNAAKK
jgi:hypothetical protein